MEKVTLKEIGDIWLILDSMRDLKGQHWFRFPKDFSPIVDLAFGTPPTNLYFDLLFTKTSILYICLWCFEHRAHFPFPWILTSPQMSPI